MCRGKTMLQSPGIQFIRNSVLTSQVFLIEDNKDRQAGWRLEFMLPRFWDSFAGLQAFVEVHESCTIVQQWQRWAARDHYFLSARAVSCLGLPCLACLPLCGGGWWKQRSQNNPYSATVTLLRYLCKRTWVLSQPGNGTLNRSFDGRS